MKKVVILFLFMLPLVNALTIDNIPYNIHNLGDNILISGTSEEGFITLNLKCGEQTAPLGTITVIKQIYSKIIALTGLTGDCTILAALNNETAESMQFKLTDELIGKFTTSHNEIQLGDKITIQGYITKLNKFPIDGSAKISFTKDNIPYNIDIIEIKNGELNYEKEVLIPADIYNIKIEATDNFGNKLITEISALKVNANLIINSDVDKSSYKPGDTLRLTGTVLKATGDKPTNLNLTIYLDNNIYKFTTNEFEIKYQIPENTRSYKHDIKIEAIDEIGNKGIFLTQYYIEPIPTSLEININKTTIKPEEDLVIITTLYDQAHDLLPAEINLNIKELEYSTTINSGQQLTYKIPKFSDPGNYIIKAESNNLKQEIKFYINEVESIEIKLNGQILTIFNTGNIIFNKNLKIIANTEEIIPLFIKPNATFDIELYKLFGNGEYTIKIPYTNQEFYNVIISDNRNIIEKISDFFSDATTAAVINTNKKLRSSPLITLLLISIAFILLISLIKFSFSSYKNKKAKKREKERTEGRRRLEQLKKEAKKYKFDFGKPTKEDVNDFRNRVIRSYKEIEQQEQRHKSFYESDKPKKIEDYDKKDEGNAFRNMFG